jgi:hypothetical protein
MVPGMTRTLNLAFFTLIFICFLLPSQTPAQDRGAASPQAKPERLTLVDAVMCEGVQDSLPLRPAVVFSLSLGEVICYTAFDPVPEKTVIFHDWYRKDTLTSRVKLMLSPPRWSTMSRILLREADKGPWRVEITDEKGKIYRTLRFSITD